MEKKEGKFVYTMLQIAPFPVSPTPDFASKDSFLEEKLTRRPGGVGERVTCRNRGVILYPGIKEMKKDTISDMVVCL